MKNLVGEGGWKDSFLFGIKNRGHSVPELGFSFPPGACEGSRRVFPSGEDKAHSVQLLSRDCAVPLGNEAVTQFPNKMGESGTLLLLGHDVCLAILLPICCLGMKSQRFQHQILPWKGKAAQKGEDQEADLGRGGSDSRMGQTRGKASQK